MGRAPRFSGVKKLVVETNETKIQEPGPKPCALVLVHSSVNAGPGRPLGPQVEMSAVNMGLDA